MHTTRVFLFFVGCLVAVAGCSAAGAGANTAADDEPRTAESASMAPTDSAAKAPSEVRPAAAREFIRTSVELFTDRAKFEAGLGAPLRTVTFDDLDTPERGHAAFPADKYKAAGVIITGQSGQYVSRDFGYPSNYRCVSAPNMYAPGPVAAVNAGQNDGGHETTVTFADAAGRPAVVAGFGCYFIDCNYPNIGPSSIEAFDKDGRSLRCEKGFRGDTGTQLFYGFVVRNEAGEPVPAIAKVKLVNGSCFPQVYAGEGVVLDDFLFTRPESSDGTRVARTEPGIGSSGARTPASSSSPAPATPSPSLPKTEPVASQPPAPASAPIASRGLSSITPPVHGSRLTLTGHGMPVVDVRFSPDGSMLASMSANGDTILWDLRAGKGRRVASLQRNLGQGRYLAFSREAKPVLLAGTAGHGLAVDLASGAAVAEYGIRDRHSNGELLPMGERRTMVLPSGYAYFVRNVGESDTLYQVPWGTTHVPWNLSPNGERALLGWSPFDNNSRDPSRLIVLDTKSGKQVGLLRGFTAGVASAKWVDQRRVLVLDTSHNLTMWQVEPTPRLLAKLELGSRDFLLDRRNYNNFFYESPAYWECLAVSADGTTAAVSADKQGQSVVFQVTGDEVKRMTTVDVTGPLQFSHDGKRILGASPSREFGQFVTVEVASNTNLMTYARRADDLGPILTPDGADYVVGHGNGAISFHPLEVAAGDPWNLVADLALEQPNVPEVPSGLRSLFRPFQGEVEFAPGNDRCATYRWRPEASLTVAALRPGGKHFPVWHSEGKSTPMRSLLTTWSFLANGTLFVDKWIVGDGFFHAAQVDPDSGRVTPHPARRQLAVYGVRVAPDGQTAIVAAGAYRGAPSKDPYSVDAIGCYLVDVKTWKTLKTLRTNITSFGHYNRLLFSQSGRRVAALIGRKLRIWDVESGKELPLAEEVEFERCWLIDDGRVLVYVDNGNVVYGIDIDSNSQAFTWNPALEQGGGLSAIAFSGDGKLAVCGSRTGEITLREARTGAVVARRNLFDRTVGGVGFSPDGTRLGAADDERRLKVWKLDPIMPRSPVQETRIEVDPAPAPDLPAEPRSSRS